MVVELPTLKGRFCNLSSFAVAAALTEENQR
jgi:hypothetical protein